MLICLPFYNVLWYTASRTALLWCRKDRWIHWLYSESIGNRGTASGRCLSVGRSCLPTLWLCPGFYSCGMDPYCVETGRNVGSSTAYDELITESTLSYRIFLILFFSTSWNSPYCLVALLWQSDLFNISNLFTFFVNISVFFQISVLAIFIQTASRKCLSCVIYKFACYCLWTVPWD